MPSAEVDLVGRGGERRGYEMGKFKLFEFLKFLKKSKNLT